MSAPLFEGPLIELGGRTYVLPKLSFGAFQRAQTKIRDIAEGRFADPVELQAAVADVILASLQRNYPELTHEQLLDVLDWDSAQALFHQVLAISVPQGQPGELRAESPSGVSTGTPPSPT
jgi:hypothetical protein